MAFASAGVPDGAALATPTNATRAIVDNAANLPSIASLRFKSSPDKPMADVSRTESKTPPHHMVAQKVRQRDRHHRANLPKLSSIAPAQPGCRIRPFDQAVEKPD
jgi:hypothetical protein